MKQYEKNIGLKAIWQTINRRWKIILATMIPIAFVTVLVTQFFIKKTYQSSISFINNANLSTTQHSQIILQIQKEETITKTVQQLSSYEKPININQNDLLNGLSFVPFNSSNPGVVTFSFKSTQKAIVKPVLAELSNVAIEEIKNNGFPNISISSEVSNPSKVSKDSTYLLIGLVASAVLGLGIAFVDEIVSDEVYDEDDIALLGSSSYGLIVTKK